MRNRTTHIRILSDNKRRRYFKPLKYPPIPLDIDDIYVITTAGDRLDLLAKEYYGDMHYWYYIAKVNNINTITVDAGLKLRLPQIIPGIK